MSQRNMISLYTPTFAPEFKNKALAPISEGAWQV